MINTNVLQTLSEFKAQLVGFAVKPNGGTMRAVLAHSRKFDNNITMQDVLESVQYALHRGWVKEAGWFGRDKLYSMVKVDWTQTDTWDDITIL